MPMTRQRMYVNMQNIHTGICKYVFININMYAYIRTKGSQSTSARAQASPSITSRTSCCHTACEHQTPSGSLETQSLSRLLQTTFLHRGPLSPGRSSLKGYFCTPQRSHIQRLPAATLAFRAHPCCWRRQFPRVQWGYHPQTAAQ